MPTTKFYPSLDGYVQRRNTVGTWASVRDGAGTEAYATGASGQAPRIEVAGTSNQYNGIMRVILLFNTAAIPDNATIVSATLGVKNGAVVNGLTDSTRVVATTPASTSSLAASDYGQFGTTSLANEIAWADLSTSNYNVFTLNATGLANITKGGVSKFGMRSKRDAANDPYWANTDHYINTVFSETADVTSDPYLEVTYTVPSSGNPAFFSSGSLTII